MRSDGAPYAEAAPARRRLRAVPPLPRPRWIRSTLCPTTCAAWTASRRAEAVVEAIIAEGLAVTTLVKDADGNERIREPSVEAKKIMQPFGDRSKVVIEPMLTDQWFVDTAKIVSPPSTPCATATTVILPERDAKVYFHWLENIEPWCISRQLWWGHQIPVWYGLTCSAGFTDDEGDDGAGRGRDLLGACWMAGCACGRASPLRATLDGGDGCVPADDLWPRCPRPLNAARVVEVADRAAAIEALCPQPGRLQPVTQDPTHLVYPVWRDADVLDTWFSSGLWPIGTLGWPEDDAGTCSATSRPSCWSRASTSSSSGSPG
jgi:valyl-tRNA synthetase